MVFTRRELREVVLSLDYAKYYHHGTGGHNGYIMAAKLARSSNSPICEAVVAIFDLGVHHDVDEIVGRAIELCPDGIAIEKRGV